MDGLHWISWKSQEQNQRFSGKKEFYLKTNRNLVWVPACWPALQISDSTLQLQLFWVSSWLTSPTHFRLNHLHNHVSQFFKINLNIYTGICHLDSISLESPDWYKMYKFCPETIQPHSMKNRDIYWRRHKM